MASNQREYLGVGWKFPLQVTPGGKIVHAWAVEGDCDPSRLVSNLFEMEWPPRSGRQRGRPNARWPGS